MKLIDSSLPVWGKLNDAGTMTSGSVALPLDAGVWRASSVLLASVSAGSTTNRSPATTAVISESRVRLKISRARTGVSAATSPGSTHRLTSSATAT